MNFEHDTPSGFVPLSRLPHPERGPSTKAESGTRDGFVLQNPQLVRDGVSERVRKAPSVRELDSKPRQRRPSKEDTPSLSASETRARSRADCSIAAIIPLYNGAKWIEGAIRSILSQTLQPDEIVIVNDGSNDAGPVIVERLTARHQNIRLLHKPNGGQSSARNFGVCHTTSALIALLDQDDEWYPNHLEQLVKPFRERPAIPLGWTYSDMDEIDESGGLIHRHFLPILKHVAHPKTSLGLCLSGLHPVRLTAS